MSGKVDERIVDMQLNNKQFESNAKQSLKTVEDLKRGLNFDASARSLSNLDSAAKSFSLTGISAGVDAIASRFSTLGVIGMTTIANLTNSVVNMGKQMVTSLTLDPITTGFHEYETKMGSIQTILTNTASKGTTLKDVIAALEELNEYSDQTIYNFSEMTRNIGTFTAAGIDLKTSTNAIKGIANLAAGSGSTPMQAATAMYQLSQALAAGKVSLMDWNSVVNAGMGGELFQNALKKTAKQMGIFVDESVPFRQTLQDEWLTTKVLVKTLSDFAEDKALLKAATEVKTFTDLYGTMKETVQSGWAVSWEHIIGDKEQASKTLTSMKMPLEPL
jgi:tape measure domain-containing protein